MGSSQQIGIIVLLMLMINGALLQEDCLKKCTEHYESSDTEDNACKDGCRLATVMNFAQLDDEESMMDKCHNGCIESYKDKNAQEACSFGCDQQPVTQNTGSVHISISNKDPTYDVVRNQMDGIFSRVFQRFPPFFGNDFGAPNMAMMMPSGGDGDDQEDGDADNIFASMHRQMQNDMQRLQQIAHRLFNMKLQQQHQPPIFYSNSAKNTPKMMIFASRPAGHLANTFEGPNIGNKGADGSPIIATHPVDGNGKQPPHLLGYMGENPMPQEEPSWLSRLTNRARRLSILSQWLVCAALLLCLIAMLSISVAILKQIRAQRYQNIHNAHLIVPSTFGGPLPAKKVPLDGSSPPQDTTMEYPLIHDSPPPAYDQLSIHKDNNNIPSS